MMRIIQGDLSDRRVVDLLEIHLTIVSARASGERARFGHHGASIF